jgi:RHS repeat-associated protein
MQAPYVGAMTVKLPSGLTMNVSESRSAVLSNAADPLSVTTEQSVVLLNGKGYTSTYTASLRKVAAKTPLGRATTTFLDPAGHIIRTEKLGLLPSEYVYDSRGRLATLKQGSREYSLAYDAFDRLASITDPLSRSATFEYDAAGRVIGHTSGNRTTHFAYDANGNLASVSPPLREAHEFTSTAVDLTSTYSPPMLPGSGATQFRYNQDRQLTLITRADGQTIDLGYDAGGRLATMRTPHGTYEYAYGSTTGALASVSAPDGTTVGYSYDGPLVTALTWTGAVSGTVAYTYDNDFRVKSENAIPFSYDDDGMLTGAGSLTLRRDAQTGWLSGTTLGVVTDAWTYDGFGASSTYSVAANSAAVFQQQYTRDGLGRIAEDVETLYGGTTTYQYGYDPVGRLSTVTRQGTVIAIYDYDANGNRLQKTTPGGSLAATYDAQDRLLTYGQTSYTYTANGELLTKSDSTGVTHYEYDVIGNLRTVRRPDGVLIEYIIDGQNRRVGKQVNGVIVRKWLYAGLHRVIAELDGAGNRINQFVYGSRVNTPDYLIRSGVTYRIVSDHLGSVRLIVDAATANVVQMIGYDEFGNVLSDTNPGFQPFGFAGGLFDPDTNLVRFGARDYDPYTGRWTTKDPLGFDGGDGNLYAYSMNDPVNLIDPSGLLFGGAVNAGEAYGQDATDYYADVLTDPDSAWYEKVGAAVGGSFAALWTPCTSDSTFAVLSTAAGGAGGLRAAGSKAAGREFSHWIPGRALKNTPGLIREGIGLSRANGNYVSEVEHALNDPFRYRFMPRAWKNVNPINSPLMRQINRLPKAVIGTGAGGAVGGAALSGGGGCGCK